MELTSKPCHVSDASFCETCLIPTTKKQLLCVLCAPVLSLHLGYIRLLQCFLTQCPGSASVLLMCFSFGVLRKKITEELL